MQFFSDIENVDCEPARITITNFYITNCLVIYETLEAILTDVLRIGNTLCLFFVF
jgi:hypothetical protein